MRYPASEKLEIIRLVEQSHLPVRRTLEKLGIPRATFYRWYDRYPDRRAGGARGSPLTARSGLEPHPRRRSASGSSTWRWTSRNCRRASWPCASPTRRKYFVSEASVYRLLKAHDLITSPAFIVIKAADEFKDKTTAPNQLWQTDFTYLKVIGWGWFYLSTVLDDFSRYIIAWKLCTTMKAEDVTDTLDLALAASGLRPGHGRSPAAAAVATTARATSPATSPNGSTARACEHVRGAPYHPQTQGKIERWHQTLKNRILLENYYLPGDLEAADRRLRRPLQSPPLPREPRQPHARPTSTSDAARPSCCERERIKRQTIANRRLQHHAQAA